MQWQRMCMWPIKWQCVCSGAGSQPDVYASQLMLMLMLTNSTNTNISRWFLHKLDLHSAGPE
jgi:hypothetical protein